MMELREVTFGHSPAVEPVLCEVSLSVGRGELVALVGPSGAGKSTVAQLFSGMVDPWQGEVLVGGRSVPRGYMADPVARRRLQVVLQDVHRAVDPRWSLRQAIVEPARRAGESESAALAWAWRCGLTPRLLARRPEHVSTGQLQRALVARALALRPHFVICDEITSAQDAASTALLARLVQSCVRDGMGALVITHDLTLAKVWADRVVPLRAPWRRTDEQTHGG